MSKVLNIVYMGTPEFAVAPLDLLLKQGYHISAVVTSPDKPAGRGLKLCESPVKRYAIANGIPLLQPSNLKSPEFIEELKRIKPDLQIVVAFRMLPEVVWKLPPSGTFNLHASLLPQYRGAAPINWAIINGEKKTGVTTFFINENIDTGNIIMSEEVPILPDETAGELHDKLMNIGSEVVLKTVKSIEENNVKTVLQQSMISNIEIKPAPKIFRNHCRINWNNSADKVYDRIRGLSPYPSAYTELLSPQGNQYCLKIYKCEKEHTIHNLDAGSICTNCRTHLSIAVTDGFINLQEIQLQAKKKMTIAEFLCGFQIDSKWKAIIV